LSVLYPIRVLGDAEARVAGMSLARALAVLSPERVTIDLGGSSLRRAVWCLPVIDAIAEAFPRAFVRVRADREAASILNAHRPGVEKSGPRAPNVTELHVDLTPGVDRVGLEERDGTKTLAVPDAPYRHRHQHASAHAVDGAQVAGLPARARAPRLRLRASVQREARAVCRSLVGRRGGPFVVLAPHPGGWSTECFAFLAARLSDAIGSRAFVLGDAEIAGAARLPDLDAAVRAALTGLAAVCVGDDGDWSHVAAAAGAPTVITHGPSSPVRTGPSSRLGASVFTTKGTCDDCRAAPGRRCLACLDPSRVARVAEDLSAQRWPVDRLLRIWP
jgi:ADP-heptose:LPS heptosyltransferase